MVSESADLNPVGFAGVRKPLLLTLGMGALLLGLAVGTVLLPRSMTAEQYVALGYYPLNQPKQIEVDSLMTHTESDFLTEHLKGRWSLLFFGYSHCPDVCPTTLGVLNSVSRELSDAGSRGQPQIIMVTVDPDRDTAAKLAGYVPYFNSEFIGVTGSVEAILSLTAQLNIGFEKVPDVAPAIDSGSYSIAHSTQIVVIDPQGYYTGMLTAPHQSERIVKVLSSLMSE